MSLATHTGFLAAAMLLPLAGCADNSQQQLERATAQVERLAEELDTRTTDTGIYIRAKANDIQETDPWGTRLQVAYSQGGVAEQLIVRSAGPDQEFHTPDDVVASGFAANFKGVGEGIKRNVQETAAGAAKGLVKGTVSGVKESLKESFSRKPNAAPAEPAAAPPAEKQP
ncbi:MAG: hypothetical protein AB7O59_14625 [Pirellulales bacterium]